MEAGDIKHGVTSLVRKMPQFIFPKYTDAHVTC